MTQKRYYSKQDNTVYVEPKNHRRHDIIFVLIVAAIIGFLLGVLG